MAGKFKSHDIDIHVYEKNIDIQRDIDILNPIHNPYEYIFLYGKSRNATFTDLLLKLKHMCNYRTHKV